MVRSLLVLAGVIAVSSAQCALGDHPNCANWVRAGFCVNAGYSKTMKAQYCPKSCAAESGCGGSAGTATTTVATAKVDNKNCAKWNADPKNVFCASAKPEQKTAFCSTACDAEIKNADQCAVYIQTGDKVARKTAVAATPAAPTTTTAGDKILHAFAKTKCKVDVYDIAAPVLPPTANPTAPKQTCDGTAADKYCPIDAANQAALSFVCSCTP